MRDSSCYIVNDTINTCLSNSGQLSHSYELSSEFKKFLSDTEVYYSGSKDNKLTLKEIYNFPRLENIEADGIVVDSEAIFKNHDFEKVIIFGQDQSGKTALLKMIFSHWYYHGYTPIFLDCKDNITNENVRQAIKNVYKKQYNYRKTSYDQYLSLSTEKKLLLIDNFHLLKSKVNKDTVLKSLLAHSEKIIISADDISSLDEGSLGENMGEFTKFLLLPFGYEGRDQLIEKWLTTQYFDVDTLLTRKMEIHRQVNNILGTNLVPSFPIYILTILQAIEIQSPSKMEISSSGHCYQALIYLSFRNLGLKDDQYEAIDNFLSFIAFHLFSRKTHSLSQKRFRELHIEYLKHFIITKNTEELLALLCKAKIFEQDSLGNFKFKYEYIYYYYIAKYLSKEDILKAELDKGLIENLFEHLDLKENASILLFLTHHCNNMSVIEEIVFNTMGQDKAIPLSVKSKKVNQSPYSNTAYL